MRRRSASRVRRGTLPVASSWHRVPHASRGDDLIAMETTRVPVWHEEHLRLAVEAARIALWSWHVDDDRFAMDERGLELWGLPWCEQVTFEELSANIHPADWDRVRAAFNATRSVAGGTG
jgi:PAS domain-containing protein